jgi:hypothetical protein
MDGLDGSFEMLDLSESSQSSISVDGPRSETTTPILISSFRDDPPPEHVLPFFKLAASTILMLFPASGPGTKELLANWPPRDIVNLCSFLQAVSARFAFVN